MTTLNAGTPVKSGYYFSLKSWTIHPMSADGEQLPGAADEKWIPMSLPVAVVAAPMLGAGFLMFMPFIGFYLTAKALSKPVVNLFHRSTEEIAAAMGPGLVPGEAHLTGKEGEAKGEAKGESPELAELQKDIDAKRAPKA